MDAVADVGHIRTKSLTSGCGPVPYLFAEHELSPGGRSSFMHHPVDHRSLLVVRGEVRLEFVDGSDCVDSVDYGCLEGWHAPPGSAYRMVDCGTEPAVLIEAGTVNGGTEQLAESEIRPPAVPCSRLAAYRVRKPWGHEIWYTQNLDGSPYALKQIHFKGGFRSSLQSHRYRHETNYVVDGVAVVLHGTRAPEDPGSTVDPGSMTKSVHGPRAGWYTAPNELHRLVARTDFTTVEVSTPELDDVIRWQDDTGRSHGRVETEHNS